MSILKSKSSSKTRKDIDLERHEAKYIIHPDQVREIREFIAPFVHSDPHASGSPPEYIVTTLQLDTHNDMLYAAKEIDAINRFKLRIRTYGTDHSAPIILEVKRKIRGIIVKTRSVIPADQWNPDPNVFMNPTKCMPFRSAKEEHNYLNFLRLVKLLDARPVTRIRYIRESYVGTYDNYSRVTLDRNILYQPAQTWEIAPDRGRWLRMDSTVALNIPFSGLILELKTFNDAPLWMLELVQRFNLVRTGFCKYFVARRLEFLFDGNLYSDTSENCTYT